MAGALHPLGELVGLDDLLQGCGVAADVASPALTAPLAPYASVHQPLRGSKLEHSGAEHTRA